MDSSRPEVMNMAHNASNSILLTNIALNTIDITPSARDDGDCEDKSAALPTPQLFGQQRSLFGQGVTGSIRLRGNVVHFPVPGTLRIQLHRKTPTGA